jgi:hypothetical protein
MSRKRDKTVSRKPIESGVAWYRRDQWEQLLSVSTDRSDLEDTYEEWVNYAQHGIQVLENQGVRLVKVDVDVDDLIRWCADGNREVDAEARADFVADKVCRSDLRRRFREKASDS